MHQNVWVLFVLKKACRLVNSKTALHKTGWKSKVAERQKGVIAFSGAKRHPVKVVVEFASALMFTVIWIYKQWQNFTNTNIFHQDCGRKETSTGRDRRRISRPVKNELNVINVNSCLPSPLPSFFCKMPYIRNSLTGS